MKDVIGRHSELKRFNHIYNSYKSEFVAVYGRRRVGKTYLINQFFNNKYTFKVTGIGNSTNQEQLANFHKALKRANPKAEIPQATNWLDSFEQLRNFLRRTRRKRIVVFIDELPWFDSPNSGFIQALEHFWNDWASVQTNIVLIVCGSATTWMINKLINNTGGLHNRVTQKIKLMPFTLAECEEFLKRHKTSLDRYQILEFYMVFGGIPFYWDQIEKGLSATQNIDKTCFSENGVLRSEFQNLYRSLFKNAERHESIVKALAQKSMGLTRDEIIKQTQLPSAGSTTRLLKELEESGFIRKYSPWGKKSRNSLYQLVDFYTHFYFKFIANTQPMDRHTWINLNDTPKHRAWSGYAFEQLCWYHLTQIKHALEIGAVQTTVSTWRSTESENGAQVDLVLDRRDQIINLCEAKFSINRFSIDKKYVADLRNKIGAFRSETKTRKSVFLCMITTHGVNQNENAIGLAQNQIVMDDLFYRVNQNV